MYLSIFTDELGIDLTEGAAMLREWGLRRVDLRGRIFGKACERLDDAERKRLRALLDEHGFKVGCLESSLAKVHLPDADRRKAEAEKLENIIRAADALDCRLVRGFFFWQPPEDLRGKLPEKPDQLQQVLDMSAPLIERARAAGLTLAFENCGVMVEEIFAVMAAFGDRQLGLAWDCANEWCWFHCPPDKAGIAQRVEATRVIHAKATGLVPGLHQETVPWGDILFRLAARGFRGPVSIETHNPDKSVTGAEMSRRCLDELRRVWPGSGAQAATTHAVDFAPVRFVIVGANMGRARGREMKQTPGAELAAIVDLNAERVKAAGEQLDVPWGADLAPWLAKDDVDVVFIVTPTGTHAGVAEAAFAAGKHVLSTKPMEASLAGCDRMIAAAAKAGKLLGVDFQFRLEPSVQRMKQRVDRGDLGELRGGTLSLKIQRTMDYFRESGGWRGTRAMDGGGVMSNQNIHHIDELIYVLGLPEQVSMHAWTQQHEIEAEDLACALWRYAGGAVVQIHATTLYPANTWYVSTELYGAQGALVRRVGGPYPTEIERWFIGDHWEEAPAAVEMPPWKNMAQNFAAAVRTGAPLICDGRDGRRSRAVLDAMYASAARDGAWVALAEFGY